MSRYGFLGFVVVLVDMILFYSFMKVVKSSVIERCPHQFEIQSIELVEMQGKRL